MEWKNKLISYNIEDCLSLKLVVDFLYSIGNDTYRKEFPETVVSNNFTEEIQSRYGGIKFGNHNFILEDYNFINKKAYFDYQKNKIFIRTQKKSNIRKGGKYFTNKPNQIITLKKAEPCFFCGSLNTVISKTQKTERIITDLKILKFSVRRWIIKYVAHRIHCTECDKWFNSSEYKKIGKKYGHNLISWVIYHYVANNTSFEKIEKTIEDFFKISIGEIGSDSLQRFKELAAEYYKDSYQNLINSIHKWHILHTDETRFRLKSSNGYIWVLTNLETVVFMYRSDRTCTFLDKIVENFNGVLISDFFKGYEALNCKQQKCLIHLLRDVNDILFKEQQNDELKIIANRFSSLLRKIVSTIDTYGLKKRNLHKHMKDVELFYKEISLIEYKSKQGKALFERFIKSKKTFLLF